MNDKLSKYDELLKRYRELQMVCDVWVAANDAKDQHIADLEEDLARAQRRVARLSRLVGRQSNALPQRKRRVTEAL
ncbi:MAG: hypothetical protein KAI47_20955 [Deltaproteobacteria bacterium]|nr:hypothetical protein [Deltaproteobacteria bacterium]